MLSKKYIVVLAVTGLMFSCQKEVIRPVSQEAVSVSSDDESTSLRLSNPNGSSTDITSPINGNIDDLSIKEIDTDITDPNNDDDRNKKKKN